MKSKIKSVISSLLAVIMLVAAFSFTLVALTGCGEETDASVPAMTVYSNGGSVVEYGDYIYFVNGIALFPSMEETTDVNATGEVQKGALYRAKKHSVILNGMSGATEDERAEFKETNIDFATKKMTWKELRNYSIGDVYEKDEHGKDIPQYIHTDETVEHHVVVEPIVKKIIGTSYFRSGIWIFDDKIYFASPANTLDKDGKYQYNKIDFFTCDLEGRYLTKLYTTNSTTDIVQNSESKETESVTNIPFNFTKQNGKVYLTTFERWYENAEAEKNKQMTGHVVNVEIANGRMLKTTIVANDVEAVYFPSRETYNSNASTNTIYDFLYTMRPATTEDNNVNGYVVEMMRPTGEDRMIIVNNGEESTIEGVSGDFFYYRNTYDGKKSLEYTNLYTHLMTTSYEKEDDGKGGLVPKKDDSGNYVVKSGNTFYSEQKAILDGYSSDTTSEGYKKYTDEYIEPMTFVEHIIISDINNDVLTVSEIHLLPFKSFDAGAVSVIARANDRLYNISASEAKMISASKFTPVSNYGTMLYGYNEENKFAFIDAFKPASSNGMAVLSGNYSNVNQGGSILMDIFPVHDGSGKLIDVYASYFTDYPNEKSVGYTTIIKIAGEYNAAGRYAVPMADILRTELKAIVCLNPDCIDYTHDHSQRDGFVLGERPASENPDDYQQM